MTRLKRIFFDIDDTLFSTTDFTSKARENSIDAMLDVGIDVDREVLVQELNEVLEEFPSNYPRHYDKLLLRLPDEALEGVNPAVVVASAVLAYHKQKNEEISPFPDAKKLLSAISNADSIDSPGVITEGLSVKQAEKLLRLDLYSYFDPEAIFISEQLGISKPNPKLFYRAVTEAGNEPSHTMYVGDKPGNDVDPANKVGMISVHIDKGTKHSDKDGQTKPDYYIQEYRELHDLLVQDFGLDLEW